MSNVRRVQVGLFLVFVCLFVSALFVGRIMSDDVFDEILTH